MELGTEVLIVTAVQNKNKLSRRVNWNKMGTLNQLHYITFTLEEKIRIRLSDSFAFYT